MVASTGLPFGPTDLQDPGGKTTAIAILMKDEGGIIATDRSYSKETNESLRNHAKYQRRMFDQAVQLDRPDR